MVEGGLEESFLFSFLNLKRPLYIVLEAEEQWTGVGDAVTRPCVVSIVMTDPCRSAPLPPLLPFF